jgi:hypothetical protein
LNSRRPTLCCQARVSPSRRTALTSHTQPLPTGPRVITPHLSAAAPVSRASVASPFRARPPRPHDVRRPPLSERPGATAPMPCRLKRRRTLTPLSPLHYRPHVALSRPPSPPFSLCRAPSAFKRAGRRPDPLCRPAPSHPSSSTSPPPPSSRDSVHRPRTPKSPPPPQFFRRRTPPSLFPHPPVVRPSQSTAIFHFGAALTTLVLPCSSRS